MNQNQTISEWETLKEIKQTIFNLEKNNISQSASSIINIMDDNYIFSINLIICKMIYTLSSIRIIDTDIYLNFIKEIEKMEGQKVKQKISEVFAQVAFNETSQESCYLIEKMIEQNLLNPEILHSKNINKSYFIHYMPYQLLNEIYNNGDEEFIENIEQNLKELSKNDWELHKKHIKEGHNPNEIAKIIRNDEIEKLQEISSQTNFNFNQIIYPSLYERCSFINQRKITLIDYAAFFGSIKCFKYLLLNKSKVKKTGKYAIAGGNLEIIHLCKQYHSSFEGGHEIAIKFHRNDIFYYLYENKIVEINELEELGKLCIIYHNYEILSFLQEEGMKITDDIINKSAKVGNIFLVNYFLKSNPIPKTILIYSSESGNIELVKHILVEKKGTIDVNTKNDKGYTALLIETKFGHIEIFKLLLEQEGIDINAKEYNGNTALILATKSNQIEMIKLLLKQKGININEKNNLGYTTLMYAVENGNKELIKLLLKQKGIDINAKNEFGYSALIIAYDKNKMNIVKLLLEQEGIDINIKNKDGETILMNASANGYIELVKLILPKEGNDINFKDSNYGKTALMFASENGHTEIVKLLLKKEGIDVNVKDNKQNTALIWASEKGHTNIVDFLVDHKEICINSKNIFGDTALMEASKYCHMMIVNLLLAHEEIDINAQNEDKQTALILASKNGHIIIVKLLVDCKGIDVNLKDKNGNTALIWATENNYTDIGKLLIEHQGIDFNAKNNYGRTALMMSSRCGNNQIVELLLKQKGIEVNAKNDGGQTALIYAALRGNTETTKLLLKQKGIDINAKDKFGQTALN